MYALLRWVMRTITRVYLVGGMLRVEGLQNVPRHGPLLVCANHISTIDPPLVPAELPRGDSWSMAKSEYFAPQRRFTRWLFSRYHAFPVVRHTADRAALKRALEVLAQGHALVLYPEGTRVDDARLREPEGGVGFIALRSGAPILPVALTGTNECFPKNAVFPRRRPLRVVFGAPFRIAQRRPGGSRVEREEAAEAIMVAIAALLPAENLGVFGNLAERRARLGELYLPVSPEPVSPSLLR